MNQFAHSPGILRAFSCAIEDLCIFLRDAATGVDSLSDTRSRNCSDLALRGLVQGPVHRCEVFRGSPFTVTFEELELPGAVGAAYAKFF